MSLVYGCLAMAHLAGFAPQNQDSPVSNWNGPESYEIKGANGKHSYRVLLRHANFRAHGRMVDFGGPTGIMIDSRPVYGFEFDREDWIKEFGTARKALERRATEIVQFAVWMDRKRIGVPRKAYSDLLNPDLGESYSFAWVSRDGKRLMVKQLGSDGAGSWSVHWTITNRGRVKRSEVSGEP